MKVRYHGKSFGVDGLTSGCVYEVLGFNESIGALQIVDDSGEDYLYSPVDPGPVGNSEFSRGHWEIIEDDEKGTLKQVIPQHHLE